MLLRASKAGIPTIPYIVTDSAKQIISQFNFPVVVFAVNPFSYDGYKIAKNRSALYRAMKSLGMNYKFDVCVQPLRGSMLSFKSIFGKCDLEGDARKISAKVYEVFRIPICKLHVQRIENSVYLCGLQPLKKEEISPQDLRIISEEVSRIFNNGDQLIV